MLNNLIENLLENSVESAGEHAKNNTFQRISIGIVLLFSAWIAVASAFLWQSHQFPGITGLLQLVELGRGPFWLLLTPIFGAVVVVLTLIPLTGRFTAVTLFSAATFGCGLGALAYVQGNGTSDINVVDLTSALAGIAALIFALVLMIGDVPALDSPMARFAFVYSGRLRHLRALHQFGVVRNWKVKAPQNRDHTLTISGDYDSEHTITITSSATFKLSTSNSTAFLLSIKETSPYDIIAFRISYDDIPTNLRKNALAGKCSQRFKRTIKFFIIPEPGQMIEASFTKRFAEIVETGRPYLKNLDFIVATPFGLRYTHKATWLTVNDVQRLESQLQWMQTLVRILEEISPRGNGQPVPIVQP